MMARRRPLSTAHDPRHPNSHRSEPTGDNAFRVLHRAKLREGSTDMVIGKPHLTCHPEQLTLSKLALAPLGVGGREFGCALDHGLELTPC